MMYLGLRVLCMNAARDGNLEALHYARSNGCAWNSWSLLEAVKYGHYDVVTYCLEKGCPFGNNVWLMYNNCMNHSNHEQALKILKLLRYFSIPWNTNASTSAARNGHIDALKWARSHGCSWDIWTSGGAVASNNSATIQYCPYTEQIYEIAVLCKDLISILKLLRKLGCL